MARKPQPPPDADDPEESRRFIDTARETEVDDTPEAMDRAFDPNGAEQRFALPLGVAKALADRLPARVAEIEAATPTRTAEHVFAAVRGFMKTLASRGDELGERKA